MSQESVHEIQLNGKQLVFLFMTATAAAVVIFLCGVLVGQRMNVPSAVELAQQEAVEGMDPTAGEPTPVLDEVPVAESSPTEPFDPSFPGRLDAEEPVSEPRPSTDAARVNRVAIAPASGVVSPSPAVLPTAAARAAETGSREPQGDGFSVQVAAVGARAEAEAIAKRLGAKGFPSFVTTPESGAANLFRVRVGKYKDRGEAEDVARRLEQEEQFKPWITR